jgi:hypothetical protein
VPAFCRHNRLIQNCPICSRERDVELRPIVSSGAPRSSSPRTAAKPAARTASGRGRSATGTGAGGGVRVLRLARDADDGYRSPLVPGLRSSADADRLAVELAFAATRLELLERDPPGLYAEVAATSDDLEERTWLAFLIAYVCPIDAGADDPFASISQARTSWASGLPPNLEQIEFGPRTAHALSRGAQTFGAYRAWVRRAGSQAAAFTGELTWPGERRFARVFERLALPGLHRDARFDLLVTLGRVGAYDLHPGALQLGGTNEVTVAAKRVLGIGDSLLLERRSTALANACAIPIEALDLGFYNWGRRERARLGIDHAVQPSDAALRSSRTALGL